MPGKTRFLAPPAAGGAEPVNSRVRLFGTRSRRFEDQLKQKKERTAEGRFVLFGASNRTRTCDTIGQKHSRTASLGALALLLVSSCSAPPYFCHWQREGLSQLTAACVRLVHSIAGLNPVSDIKTTTHPQGMDRCFGTGCRNRTPDQRG